MTNPRLAPAPPVEQMNTQLQQGGEPLLLFRTLGHNPNLLRRVMSLGNGFLFKGNLLPVRAREIVILRVAYRSGSVYEFGQHTLIGGRAGLTQDEIGRLAQPDAGEWTDDERDLIAMVDELAESDVVDDATWERLRATYDDATLVELLLLPGYYRMLAGFMNSAGVQLDPNTPGWPE